MTLQIHRQELIQNLPLKPKLQEGGPTRFLIYQIILVAEMRAKNNKWTINKFTLHYCIVAIFDPVPYAIQTLALMYTEMVQGRLTPMLLFMIDLAWRKSHSH